MYLVSCINTHRDVNEVFLIGKLHFLCSDACFGMASIIYMFELFACFSSLFFSSKLELVFKLFDDIILPSSLKS